MAQVDKIFFEELKLNIKFNKLDCTKSTIVEDRTLDDFLKDEVYKFAYDFVRKCVALTLQSEDVFVKIFTRAELLYEYTLSLEHLELRWSDVMNKANSLFDFWDKDYDSFADFYYSLVTKAIPNTAHILYVFYILLYKRNPDKKVRVDYQYASGEI